MREIKFRAWLKDSNRMTYSFTVLYQPTESEDDEHVLMQYTGLKDKNGKEIYEGDIVYLPNTPNQYNYVVVYDEKQAKYKLSPIDIYLQNSGNGEWTGYDFSTKTMVVIGNIYENQELLNN